MRPQDAIPKKRVRRYRARGTLSASVACFLPEGAHDRMVWGRFRIPEM